MATHTTHRLSPLAVACMIVAGSFGPVAAPLTSAQQATLEEVIGSARKRDENLMDIPESVTAISGMAIERQNIKGLNKIGLAVPNLNLSMRTDGYPNVSIRGLGAFGMTQGVGFYLDDVQLFSDASSRFGDLARIEVLKGPQGVLYGGSNIGGAVKYVSKAPSTDGLSGRIKGLAGEQGIVDVEGDINIPLSDNWALRAFAFTREDDGFMRNPGSLSPVFGVDYEQPEDVTAYEESGGRLVLAGDLSDRASLNASVRYNEYDGPVNNWARDFGLEGNFQYPFTLDTSQNPRHERETFGARVELNIEMGMMDFKSITSYTDTESDRLTDVDLTQLWFFNTFRPETMEVLTQEFRFSSNGDGPVQWVAGVYATDFKETMNSTLDFGWIILEGDDPTVGVKVPFETRREDKSNLAAFGNVTFDLGNWELGMGLRVDRWESEEEAVDVLGHRDGGLAAAAAIAGCRHAALRVDRDVCVREVACGAWRNVVQRNRRGDVVAVRGDRSSAKHPGDCAGPRTAARGGTVRHLAARNLDPDCGVPVGLDRLSRRCRPHVGPHLDGGVPDRVIDGDDRGD